MTDDTKSDSGPARGKVASKRRISPVWFIPIVAIAIAGWLGYKTISEKGPTITITFETADGLEAGKTKVRFKDVEIGVVSDIVVADDLSHVVVTADMEKEVGPHLTDRTSFWIVRPRVGVEGVTGLGTLLSGAYITMDPGSGEKNPQREFAGLEKPPAITSNILGTQFILKSDSLKQYSQGTPVYFNDLEVGLVVDFQFNEEDRSFTLPIFVHAPYDKLVLQSSNFWSIGGLQVHTSAGGIDVETPPLEAFLRGGIAFDSPASGGDPAPNGQEFALYPDKASITQALITRRVPVAMYFGGSVRGLKVGAPVEWQGVRVGQVTKLWLVENPTEAVAVGVHAELYPGAARPSTEIISDAEFIKEIENQIVKGFRAQLKTANILTGELFIDLNFQPGAPEAQLDTSSHPPVLPSVPTELDTLRASINDIVGKLSAMPIDDIAQRLDSTMSAIEAVATAPEVEQGLKSMSEASADFAALAAVLNSESGPLMANLRVTSAELSQTVRAARDAMRSADSLLADDSSTRQQLDRAIAELTRAARSVRVFTDTLERDPSALIRGRR